MKNKILTDSEIIIEVKTIIANAGLENELHVVGLNPFNRAPIFMTPVEKKLKGEYWDRYVGLLNRIKQH